MRQGNVLVGKLSIDLEWLRLGSACSLSSAIVQACWKGNRQRLWTGSEQGPGPGAGPGTEPGTGLVRRLCAPFNGPTAGPLRRGFCGVVSRDKY